MSLLDASLSSLVVVIGLLFITGGFVPPSGAPRLLTEMNQLGPWVAVVLLLALGRRLLRHDGTIANPVLRRLGTLAKRGCQTSWPLRCFIAIWAVLLIAVSVRRHLAFEDNGDLAIFDQAFWNTVHGAFMRSTLIPSAPTEVSV